MVLLPEMFSKLVRSLSFAKAPSPLLPIIKDIIRQEGPISIERYTEIVLQHPQHGYYRHGDPLGADRDFDTAPKISQMFGEMVALWCLEAWEIMGKPNPFILLELGPGQGTLFDDLLRFTEPVADFHGALRLNLLESNATLRDLQRQKLGKFHPTHLESLSQLEPLPIIVVTNEFFDNIPIRQFVKTDAGWVESQVDLENDKLVLTEGKQAFPRPPDNIAPEFLEEQKPGWVHEFSDPSRKMVKQLAAHIVRYGGAGLIIDYGYVSPSGMGTLDAWSRSQAANILKSPGNTDVTADVDFYALRHVAEEENVLVSDVVGQGEFLSKRGIKARAEFFKSRASKNKHKRIDDSLNLLVSSKIMGNLWKVMEIKPTMPSASKTML